MEVFLNELIFLLFDAYLFLKEVSWIDSHVIQTIAPSSGSGSSMQYIQLSTSLKIQKLRSSLLIMQDSITY